MKYHLLLGTQIAHQCMRIAAANQKAHLKEEQAGRPDRRTPAVPWQDMPRDDRLNQKEQKRAGKDC
jgi:hypothetical protein